MIAAAGGLAGAYILVAIAFSGYCGDNGCPPGQGPPSEAGQLVAGILVLAGVLAVMTVAGAVAMGSERRRALGRVWFGLFSVLLLPMYPFAIWGVYVASRHVRLDMTTGFLVAVALLAIYLVAWSMALGVVARRRTAATGP